MRGTSNPTFGRSKARVPQPRPRGSAIVRPLPALALVVLVTNDRWWKAAHPGFLTGKLSDFAGLALLTYAFVAAADIALPVVGLRRPGPRFVLLAAVCFASSFALVKSFPAVADLYGLTLGWLRAPLQAPVRRVEVTHDVSDVVAVLGTAIAWVDLTTRFYGASLIANTRRSGSPHRWPRQP